MKEVCEYKIGYWVEVARKVFIVTDIYQRGGRQRVAVLKRYNDTSRYPYTMSVTLQKLQRRHKLSDDEIFALRLQS